MECTAYLLDFDAPLHIGLEGIGQESVETAIRSDTLWGALVQQWALLFNLSPEELCLRPPFRVSSCFPVMDGRLFLPVPLGALDTLLQSQKDSASIKDIKKIAYLSVELFERVLHGEELTLDHLLEPLSHWPFADLRDEQDKVQRSAPKAHYQTEQRPRLEVDRLYGGPVEEKFFYCTDQFFKRNSGVFFLADFQDDPIRQRFEAALRLLGDTGLGADRSVGRGTFTFRRQTLSLSDIAQPDRYCLLSLCHPTRAEVGQGLLRHPATAYTLLRRSGHCGGPQVNRFRRADLWMLAEGSVLGSLPQGDIPCVLPAGGQVPHPVYRYGLAFTLPMVKKEVPSCPT